MKKLLFIAVLVSGALLISTCSKKDDSSPNNNDTTKINTTTTGNFNATGTITLSAGGTNYSFPIQQVTIETSSVTITAVNTDGSNVIVSAVSSSGIGTGTYTIASYSLITFGYTTETDVCMYQAAVIRAGTTCSIHITTFSSTSVQGTFTATAALYMGSCATTTTITGGVINCTITTKKTK